MAVHRSVSSACPVCRRIDRRHQWQLITFVGTPTAAGTYTNGNIVLAMRQRAIVTKTFSMTINPAIAVSNLRVAMDHRRWLHRHPGSARTGAQHVGSTGVPTGMSIASRNTLHFTGTPTTAGIFSERPSRAIGATVTRTFGTVSTRRRPSAPAQLSGPLAMLPQRGDDDQPGTGPFTTSAPAACPPV